MTTKNATTLWAVHIQGPDDVIATASHDEAWAKTKEINEAYEQFKKREDASDLDGRWHAVVIEWDGTAETHAEDVARGDERWEL